MSLLLLPRQTELPHVNTRQHADSAKKAGLDDSYIGHEGRETKFKKNGLLLRLHLKTYHTGPTTQDPGPLRVHVEGTCCLNICTHMQTIQASQILRIAVASTQHKRMV
jgi:hypothetical protein